MRGSVVCFMVLVLLFISSAPQIPHAIAGSPKHLHDTTQHHMDDIASPRTADHEMSKQMRQCRIECACGCHNNIDTLPHLLAPHAIDMQQDYSAQTTNDESIHVAVLQATFNPSIPIPPPEFI